MDISPASRPLPHTSRPLKRSASTASLPTPPRTRRRRGKGRGRSRGGCDSDSDDNEGRTSALLSTDEEDDELPRPGQKGRKKQRLSREGREDGDEEAFWVARPELEHADDKDKAKANASDKEQLLAPSSSAPLLYRKSLQRSRSQSTGGLASPPPSHRKRQVPVPATPPTGNPGSSTIVSINTEPTSPPATPKKQTGILGRARKRGAKTPEFPIISDSPDNPFYTVPVSPSPGEDSESPRVSLSPKTPGTSNYYEKPTVTYVFRGVRREYQNPLYDHSKNRPLSPPPNSLLPIEHPDYSPDMGCKPTVLFPNARKGKRPAAATDAAAPGTLRRSPRRKRPMIGDSEDEEGEASGSKPGVGLEDDETVIKPRKLNFGPPKSVGKTKTTKATAVVGDDGIF